MSDRFVTDPLAEQLGSFGLSRIEAAIYLHLVRTRPKTILEISRALDLPRTSVYDNSEKLIEKGLIEKIVKFKSQQLRAYPPDILQTQIDQQKAKIENLQNTLGSLQAQLALITTGFSKTEVRYYNGAQGFRQMIWNTLRAKELAGYSQFGRSEIVGEAFIKKYVAEAVARGVKDRVISNPEIIRKYVTNDDPIKEGRKIYQNIRSIDASRFYVSGDITIYNDVFAVNYWKQGEVVGVEIENPELVKTQKSIFELLWQQAELVQDIW